MTLDQKITISPHAFLQIIDDEAVILNSETNQFFALNSVGQLIWEKLQISSNLNTIFIELQRLYDISPYKLSLDILIFIQQLNKIGVINYK